MVKVGNNPRPRSSRQVGIDIMQPKWTVSSEGASARYDPHALTGVPALLVFPLPIRRGTLPANAQGIYELARERARAACAQPAWALVQRAGVN